MRQSKIGLALGAGAAKGWAHIGVINALKKMGIKIDVVAGCSVGSLVGAAYASDHWMQWSAGYAHLNTGMLSV